MKRFLLAICQTTLLTAVLFGCGGGGGGGGSDDEGGPGTSAATGVRILHGAIEGAPVDLYSSESGTIAVGNGRYGDIPLYLSIPTGDNILSLTTRLNAAAVIHSGALTLEGNQHASLLLYGDETSFGLNGAILNDEPGDIPDGTYAVRAVDAVVGASAIVVVVGGQAVSNGTAFGSASSYVFLAPGISEFVVRRSSDNRIIDRGSFTFEAGKAYTVFVSGEIDYQVVTRVLED